MKRKVDRTLIITTLICLLPIVIGLVLYNKLPNEIAIHWNASGTPDNYVPKAIAVWGLPILMASIHQFVLMMMEKDPKKANVSTVLKQIGIWIIPIMSLILTPITLFKALGYNIPIEILVPVMLGVLITVFGNYLPKCKQNYTVGIRLTWTLNSTDNWNKTHHMAGYLWTIGGICLIVGGFLTIYWVPIVLIIAAILVGAPVLYSYLLYKKGI